MRHSKVAGAMEIKLAGNVRLKLDLEGKARCVKAGEVIQIIGTA